MALWRLGYLYIKVALSVKWQVSVGLRMMCYSKLSTSSVGQTFIIKELKKGL